MTLRHGLAGSLLLWSVTVTVSAQTAPPLSPAYVDGQWGYLARPRDFNAEPQFAIPPQFERAGPFREGLAPVRIAGRYGYIDADGKPVIEPKFELADVFAEGLASVRLQGLCGCIDRSGEFAIPPRFEWCGSFSQGLAPVRIDGRYGYVNKVGEVVISPQFELADAFSESLAAVTVEGRRGYINRAGDLVIEARFPDAGRFREGLALALVDDGYGYLNAKGEFAIAPRYVSAGEFHGAIAPASQAGKLGFIDRNGNFVIDPQFEAVLDYGPNQVYAGDSQSLVQATKTPAGGYAMAAVNNQYFQTVQFESLPAGAVVYTPTLWDYEHAPSVQALLTARYRVANKPSTHTFAPLDKFTVYQILFEYRGRVEEAPCIPPLHPKVSAEFQ